MADRLNARVLHMHDIEENWNKCVDFIPEKSEIIVYDIDESHPYPRFKIGDGVTKVTELEFTVDSVVKALFTIRNDTMYIDSGYIG
jgi:hypothetical protein